MTTSTDRVLKAAGHLNLPALIAEAFITKGTVLYLDGRSYEGLTCLHGGLWLAEDQGLAYQQVRALNNISDSCVPLDPAMGLGAARKGLGIVWRLGLRDMEMYLCENGCRNAISTGDWDWIDETVTAALGEGSDILNTRLLGLIAVMRANRGDAAGAEDILKGNESLIRDSTDPQDMPAFLICEARVALAAGSFEKAHEKASAAAQSDYAVALGVTEFSLAGRAALWRRDVLEAREALAALAAIRVHGEWPDLAKRQLEAGIAALEGRMDDATALYVETAGGWRALGVPFDLALGQLDFVTFVGPREPAAQKAADEAGQILRSLGAKPFLDRLHAAAPDPAGGGEST